MADRVRLGRRMVDREPDMPSRADLERARELALRDGITRRGAADLLGVHPDTVTRWLPAGLGAAVVSWGGRGKDTILSRRLVARWREARMCHERPRPCGPCDRAMFAFEAAAEHALEFRHGFAGCVDCWYPWPGAGEPCAHGG